jgi:hypothetical protein
MGKNRITGVVNLILGGLICLWQFYELNSTNHFTFWIIGFIPLPVIVLGVILVVVGLWGILGIGLSFRKHGQINWAGIEIASIAVFAVIVLVPLALLGLFFANSILPIRVGATCGFVASIGFMGYVVFGGGRHKDRMDWSEKMSTAGCSTIIAVLLGFIGALIGWVVTLFLS